MSKFLAAFSISVKQYLVQKRHILKRVL